MILVPYPKNAPIVGWTLICGRRTPVATHFDSQEAAEAFASEWNVGDEGKLFAVTSSGASAAAFAAFEAHQDGL